MSLTPSQSAALAEAASLDLRVADLYRKARFRDAVPIAKLSCAIREKVLGPRHVDVAGSLNNLAMLYQASAVYDEAEPLLIRALSIFESALSSTHLNVATSLNNLALLYQAQNRFQHAEPLYIRALNIREQHLDRAHPDVAASLSNLGMLYFECGMYEIAKTFLTEALNVRVMAISAQGPEVASSLNNLAGLHQAKGYYEEAERRYSHALKIREAVLGPMHVSVATSLNNLAGLHQQFGRYSSAQLLLMRALEIYQGALGDVHPDVARCMHNLAVLYDCLGMTDRAEALYVRALNLLEHSLGPMHVEVAKTLDCLALHYKYQKLYAFAESLYLRAIDIIQKALGAKHPNVAASMSNLAMLYKAQRAWDKAEPMLIRAAHIIEHSYGSMHPSMAMHLNNLAGLYQQQGSYEQAEPLLLRALYIRERRLGPMNPDVATSMNNLAALRQSQGAYDEAGVLMMRAAEIREEQLRTELPRLSEPSKRALMVRLRAETHAAVSLHADVVPDSVRAAELAFTTVLRRKGRLLDSLVDTETTLRAHLTETLQGRLDELARTRAELVARLYSTSQRDESNRAEIATVRARIDDLEAELSAACAPFCVQGDLVTIEMVRAALPCGTALVEFARYQQFDALNVPQCWRGERYIAYILTGGGTLQWVALGDAAPVDAMVGAVLTMMHADHSLEATKLALRRLDDMVFAPIRSLLTGISHTILAPDGALNLVPFDALIDANGSHILEHYLVSYVTTGRELTRFAARHPPRSPPVVVAGADYGTPQVVLGARQMSFGPLAGALAEAATSRHVFQPGCSRGRMRPRLP